MVKTLWRVSLVVHNYQAKALVNPRLVSLIDPKSCICITLGCYMLVDLKEQFDTGRFSTFEQQLSCTPSKWPQRRGSLSLKVISAESKEENLPLSPPFQVNYVSSPLGLTTYCC